MDDHFGERLGKKRFGETGDIVVIEGGTCFAEEGFEAALDGAGVWETILGFFFQQAKDEGFKSRGDLGEGRRRGSRKHGDLEESGVDIGS